MITYLIAVCAYKFALTSSNALIFQNPDDLNLFKKLGLVSIKKQLYRVYGSGVNLKQFYSSQLPKENVFLMVSRLLKHKGVIEYLEAAKIVKSKYKNAIFYLAGFWDTNPSALKKEDLDPYIENDSIKFLGEVRPVQQLMEKARFYVLPSYREGTPRSVLEAMAMRKPIITTDVPGCRETVISGKNGFLVPYKDAISLSEAMIKAINLPEPIVEDMAEASLNMATEFYDVKKVTSEIISIITTHYSEKESSMATKSFIRKIHQN